MKTIAPTLFALSAVLPAAALAQTPPRTELVAPRIVVQNARTPVQLARVEVDTRIVGSLATSRIELVLRNPNDRVLEGALEFPLRDGQTVSGFALDIQGQLMPAVPVAKDRGQQIFEEVTRRNVDPALLEQTAGNNFRLRVYPLPAHGERRVVLQVSEALHAGKGQKLQYLLPIDFGQRIGRFRADLTINGVRDVQTGGVLEQAQVLHAADDTVLRLERSDWQPQGNLSATWRDAQTDRVLTGRYEDRNYFQADVQVPAATGERVLPRDLVLVWDASGSGAARDHVREFALLDALMQNARQLRVHLIVARDTVEAPRDFAIKDGDWRELRRSLEALAYDGASNPAAWTIPAALAQTGTVGWLFSDGLGNWGDLHQPKSGLPLYTINAATRADADRLRSLAETSGARYVDLNAQGASAALDALVRPSAHLISLDADGAEQLVALSVHPEDGRLTIAGVLNAKRARVTLTLAGADGKTFERSIEVNAPIVAPPAGASSAAAAKAGLATTAPDALFPPLAAQRWAQLKIAQLAGEYSLHRAEIRRLGERFLLVTRETSLIVLDDLADYVRYEITPPAGPLRIAYAERMQAQAAQLKQSRSQHLDDLAHRFAEKAAWWSRDFPKGDQPKPQVAKKTAAVGAAEDRLREESQRSEAPMPAMAAPAALARSAPAPMSVEVAGAPSPKAQAQDSAPNAHIALRQWEPDAPYARRLRDARDDQRYAVYLDERPNYLASTAFYIDAADVFFAKGQTELALRVLSNLAEMDLENRHILRILAYRLQQANQTALALPLLERVRELAPEEPQSWRDLGLAYAADGQAQRAADMLWETVARPWDDRFADIDLIALAELNALAARNPGLDTAHFDRRLLKNLPLDVRAVLAWDADNTDIDLWVIDPNGEAAYYGHKLTYQGGLMSRDFTQGYGPEEFSLRHAKPGHYEVRAKFYGNRQQLVSPYTTVMLWLSTGFGTAGQKDERVVLRLTAPGDQIFVGSFEVEAPGKAGAH